MFKFVKLSIFVIVFIFLFERLHDATFFYLFCVNNLNRTTMNKKNAIALMNVLKAQGRNVKLIKSAKCADCWDLVDVVEEATDKKKNNRKNESNDTETNGNTAE